MGGTGAWLGEEVRWIQRPPSAKSVSDAIPPVFEAYATLDNL